MQKVNIPRIVIAGTQSGCGKTTITCAVLKLLVDKGLKTASFKCGPDYIDPMFHSEIIGSKSSNLDAFFCDEKTIRHLFCTNSSRCDIAVTEGVMGFYDGLAFDCDRASTYQLAKIIKAPVILTINCKGLANSVLAVIKGFKELKQDSNIKGVILNNTTNVTYIQLKKMIEDEFFGEVKVLGYLPKLKEELTFKSRHLGLVTAMEIADIKQNLQNLADIASTTIDLDGIIKLANSCDDIAFNAVKVDVHKEKIKIAVAKDKAFCFYYSDNLRLLEEMGAQICFFSPIDDAALPQNIDGIYLGGGYPELYLNSLTNNKSMLTSIKAAIGAGTPCIAECGGYMYLTESIDGVPMVGALAGKCYKTDRLSNFGYVNITANHNNIFCKKGQAIKAHEFHYYHSDIKGESFAITKESGASWYGVFADNNLYAGFPHMHFYSNLQFAQNFYNRCAERKMNHDRH